MPTSARDAGTGRRVRHAPGAFQRRAPAVQPGARQALERADVRAVRQPERPRAQLRPRGDRAGPAGPARPATSSISGSSSGSWRGRSSARATTGTSTRTSTFLQGHDTDRREPCGRVLAPDRPAHQGGRAPLRPPLRDAAQFRRVPRAGPRAMSKRKRMYLHPSADGSAPASRPLLRLPFPRRRRATARRCPTSWTRRTTAIKGAHVPIQQVGVSNFRLPLKFRRKKGATVTLETSVTGTVSLEAELKGINMSRIVRSFYDHKGEVFTGETVGRILKTYLRRVRDARTPACGSEFSYPILQRSLRSGLEGYQYLRRGLRGRADAHRQTPALRPFRLRVLLGLPLLGRAGRARARRARRLRRPSFTEEQGPAHARGGRGQEDLDRGHPGDSASGRSGRRPR